ncbi:methyltransferase domain-containing protein [Candidatus Woesebacteria bacterium]|nr:methyltransferase domain-containing protein [Candidatus Woesebacteria bacterium]
MKNNLKQIRTYADGAEKQLLDFFTTNPQYTEFDVAKFLNENADSWSIQYHLSPQRHFLLNWYDFKPNSTLLEIGAGCGAVTGLFLSRTKKVVANELEKNRADVIRARFSDQTNLKVNSQSIKDFSTNEKFDYVVVIGVLEYAGVFFDNTVGSTTSPHKDFLLKAKSLLKKDGTLLLAIENRLGLKYFSGHPEDHTGILYDSLNNYASQSKIQTFSRSEISELFHEVGFSNLNFFYPFPDYKLPFTVFSEKGLSHDLHLSVSEYTASPAHNHPYTQLLSETALAITLQREKISSHFANSFLIEAKK